MLSLLGAGWWAEGVSAGMLKSGADIEPTGGQHVFKMQFNNFGRMDAETRATAFAVELALKDAALGYPLAPDKVAGIVGSSPLGCLGQDMLYFQDYVECGRTLGRGNYFIYTLPTSPLAECAIHFGLNGPVLYTADAYREGAGHGGALVPALEAASRAISDAQATVMLAGAFVEGTAIFMVLGQADGGMETDKMAGLIKGGSSLDETLDILGEITKTGGAGR